MQADIASFPRQDRLWPGAILATIAHAVANCRFPMLSHERSWQGDNYSVQDSEGGLGTIAFQGRRFVGVFFLADSPRNPFGTDEDIQLEALFRGMPDALHALAYDEACQYSLVEHQGRVQPAATAAFWGDGMAETIAAAEPWADVLEHGASLVENELLEASAGLAHWKTYNELSDGECELVWRLYQERVAAPAKTLVLTDADRKLLESRAEDEEGLEACMESFGEINVRVI